ncbi:hypothetical protein EDD16DRAFT_1524101 [Pisolithus croceorrhizus]|nr:hypothetical protein EDD16DRAFT_1524101 [Pisolithus croceorrhizus]KAI6114640.1 hypothetical protein EV401DRAFT_1889940 [Pisolithus croceorrhizus]KAI6160534.1 hypothetical protein EDD17DRAFT_1510212 [Pisolithus thermaeus]
MNFSPICISINVDLSHCRPQSLSNYPMGLARPFLPSFGFPRDPAHLRTTTLFSCPLFAMHEICSETRLEFMMRTYTSLESLLGNPFRFCTTPTRRGALPAGQRSPRLPHFEYTGTILPSSPLSPAQVSVPPTHPTPTLKVAWEGMPSQCVCPTCSRDPRNQLYLRRRRRSISMMPWSSRSRIQGGADVPASRVTTMVQENAVVEN